MSESLGKVRHALIVAGPTCSGKSALAIALASRLDGVVINADAMQVYRELRIVTARPSVEEKAMVPHRLYGVRAAAEPGSAAWWRVEALAEMEAAHGLPILCGGTGLYLAALTQGLSEIPEPEAWARAEARGLLDEIGSAALHVRLAEADPETALRLRPSDGQRIARAWEVWRSTGQSLSVWQAIKPPPLPWRFTVITIDPPREELRAAIALRFQAMLKMGVLDEIRDLMVLGLDPTLPAMRALGVPELVAHLEGTIGLDEAIDRACLVSGQYTKRQATWFRNRSLTAPDRMHTIHARIADLEQLSERNIGDLMNFIQKDG